jgi:hypothetical protein
MTMIATREIPRLADPAPEEFENRFASRGAPAIIVQSRVFEGGPRSIEEVMERGGAIRVNVRSGNYADATQRVVGTSSLAEYLANCIACDGRPASNDAESLPTYSGNTPLSKEDFRTLGLSYPMALRRKPLQIRLGSEPPRLWLGPAGSLTPLHYDSRDNLICQYIGRKHFVLYPPSDIPFLYTYGVAPSWSRVANPRQPDLGKFPLFAKARPVEVTLQAGEILYLPARWSHFVVNLDVSMMVNFWPGYTLGLAGQKAISAISRRVKQRVGFSWMRRSRPDRPAGSGAVT